jgi:hypothetical protein
MSTLNWERGITNTLAVKTGLLTLADISVLLYNYTMQLNYLLTVRAQLHRDEVVVILSELNVMDTHA